MLLISLVLGLAAGRQASASFPDTAKNHWAYEGVSYLKSQGLLVGYPDGIWDPRPPEMSRYIMAVIYNAVAHRLRTIEDAILDQSERIARSETGLFENQQQAEYEKLLDNPLFGRSMDYLARGLHEFKPELLVLGLGPREFSDMYETAVQSKSHFAHFKFPKPGSALNPFPDVPANHWAFAATTNLRAAGILHGYPDGTFNGN